MDQIVNKNMLRYVNYIFGCLVLIFYWILEDYLTEELSLGSGYRYMHYNQALPSFSLIILLTVSLFVYHKKQPFTAIFHFSYFVYVCLVTIFSLSFGHYKYVIEYDAFGTWVYHLSLCILLLLWNFSFVVIRNYSIKSG